MHDLLFVRIEQDFDYSDLANYSAQYLLADNNGKILEYGGNPKKIADIFNKNFDNTKLLLIIPDCWVGFHIVDIPVKEYKKKIQAMPYLLEEKILSNIEDTLFILGPEIGSNSNKHLVAVADKNKINNILIEFKKISRIQPSWIVTDSICLYPSTDKINSVYLNKNNNTGLVISDNIYALPLENLDLIFDQFDSNSKVPVDIYKINSENIFNYVANPKNTQKIVVNSEQIVHDWLPFLASAWLKNKTNKNKMINLALGLHGSDKFEIKFHDLWLKTALIFGVFLLGSFGYKYYDNLVYAGINLNLNKLIKSELNSVDINTTNLDDAQKLLTTKINNIEKTLRETRKKERFYLLLSAIVQSMGNKITINNIHFSNDILEINFNLDQNKLQLLDKIKTDLTSKKILLKEVSVGTAETSVSGKTNNIIWTLGL